MLFFILEFCPEHNINTFRDINLQPLFKRLFEEHPSVLPILLFKNQILHIKMPFFTKFKEKDPNKTGDFSIPFIVSVCSRNHGIL